MTGKVATVSPVNYAVLTSLSIENRCPNQTKQAYGNITRVSHTFYRQVIYDEQLQAYVFTDTNALFQWKLACTLFPLANKRNFRYNPETKQFRPVRAEECDWTVRYLVFQDVIFHQMTDLTNCVRQGRIIQMPAK